MATTDIWYVNPDAVGAGNGTSLADGYTSLLLAELAKQDDITLATGTDKIVIFRCGNTAGGADTDGVNFLGWTTAAGNYIKVESDSSYRHNGTWDNAKFRLETINASFPLKISEDYVRVDAIQCKFTQTLANTSRGIYAASGGTVDVRLSNLIIQGVSSGTGSNRGMMLYATNAYVWNCIIYGFKSGADTGYDGIYSAGTNTDIWNCTINDCYHGIIRGAGTVTALNCLAFECDDDFNGAITMTYCASDDDHTGDSVTNFVITQTADDYAALVTDADGRDYNVTDGSSELVGAGTDDPGGAIQDDTDIEGTARSSTWDIGAFEYVAGGEEHVKNLSDTINLSDARVFTFGLNKSDSITLSELLAKNVGRPLTDSISISDVIAKNVGLPESDSISMSDGIAKTPGLPKADTITLSDNASTVASFLRSLDDTINLSDGAVKSFRTTKADTITLTDNLVSTIIAIIMNINDTINLSDGIVKNVEIARADTINLSDNLSKVIAYLRSFADTITLSDLGLREAGLNKADIITFSDGIIREPRLSKADIITLSDSIAKELGLSKTDTITLSDFFSSDAGIVWTSIIIKGIDIMSGEPVFITGKYRLP